MPASYAARSASSDSSSFTPDQPICFPPISAGPPIDHAPNVSGATVKPVLPNGRLSSIGLPLGRQRRDLEIGDAEDRLGADRAEADLPADRDRPGQLLRIRELR